MPSQSRPGIKGMKSERLGRGALDHLPDVDSHPQREQLQFIHQGDIYATIDVFQQFRHFGRGGRRNRNGPIENRPIESPRQLAWPVRSVLLRPLGMSRRATVVLPGSSRSGENATKNSLPVSAAIARSFQALPDFLFPESGPSPLPLFPDMSYSQARPTVPPLGGARSHVWCP